MMTNPIELVLSRAQEARPNGSGYLAKCPAHDDQNPSLSIGYGSNGKALVKCHAGCSVEAIADALGLAVKDLFPPDDTRKGKKSPPLTVAELAEDKALPASFLESVGVKDGSGGVVIGYRMMDGADTCRQRIRKAKSAKEGSLWVKGAGAVVPYGLDRLMDGREEGYLVLVEGESDCWTLWHHGIPALGIPGADQTGKIQADYLLNIPTLYYWREPDQGGDTFARGMAVRLAGIKYPGEVREVRYNGLKDPNELHKKDPKGFRKVFQAALDAAVRIDLAPLPGKTRMELELEKDPEEVTDFLSRKIETGTDLIGNGLLASKSALMLRGWKKSFKSFDATQLAICAALGTSFYCFPVTKRSRVLVVQGEISEARYQERIKKLLSHHKKEDGTVPDIKNYMYVKNGAPKIDGDSFALIRGWVEKIKPDILILDPAYKFLRYADENSPTSMRPVFERLDELKCMDVALVICHHNRKKHAQEHDSSMGSARGAGWEEWADSIMALRRDNTDRLRCKVSFELRNAEEPPDMVVSRDPETLWGTIAGYATDARKKATATDARDALVEMGGVAESKTDLARKIMDTFGVSDKTAAARIDDAVTDNLIRKIPAKHGSKDEYRVSVPRLTETLPYADN